MTDETKFGIMQEPGTTCQFIDEEINNLNDLSTELNNSVENGFELIRKKNEELRAWGDAWKSKCLEVSEALEKAEDKVSDLEIDNKTLQETVDELQDKLNQIS